MKAGFEKGHVIAWVDRMGLCVRYGVVTDTSETGVAVAQICADDGTAVCFDEPGRIRERDEHNVRLHSDGSVMSEVLKHSPVGSAFALSDPEKRIRFVFSAPPGKRTVT